MVRHGLGSEHGFSRVHVTGRSPRVREADTVAMPTLPADPAMYRRWPASGVVVPEARLVRGRELSALRTFYDVPARIQERSRA